MQVKCKLTLASTAGRLGLRFFLSHNRDMPKVVFTCLLTLAIPAWAAEMTRPIAGPVTIMKAVDVKPGMKGTAWTVFEGYDAEPVPLEIIGTWKSASGPRQDIIIAKMGGKAIRTNVAGGMSGSPVYIDGKLMGAVAYRLSTFSPDAICGITPIEMMLEINEFDESRPMDAKVPGQAKRASTSDGPAFQSQQLIPIETPLAFSGFQSMVLDQFGGLFSQAGMTPAQGGTAGMLRAGKPVNGWQKALRPGDSVSAILVAGDMSLSAMGTVTYNDGKRILAFGHPFLNLGPVGMPLSKSDVLMVLSSQFQPNKLGNATEIVGALRQDRHNGIMGILGEESPMIPVNVKLRSFVGSDKVVKEKKLHFDIFVHQKWTPSLMMVTLFNAMSGMNEFSDEATWKLSGNVELAGGQKLALQNMQAPSEAPMPPAVVLASWWGDKFNRLFANTVKMPDLKAVDVTIDLIPERRTAVIEGAWIASPEVEVGQEVPVKVFLRPWRGERVERTLNLKIPVDFPSGQHRILLSDGDTLNRSQSIAASANRFIEIPEIASLINQERANNKLYASLVQSRPTVFADDKTLPSLPSSVLNIMQSGRASKPLLTTPETMIEQSSTAFDFVVSGSQSIRIVVK